jgi:hypothetical protein
MFQVENISQKIRIHPKFRGNKYFNDDMSLLSFICRSEQIILF